MLKKQKLTSRKTSRKEDLKLKKMLEEDLDEDIEVFNSQIDDEEKVKTQPKKGKTCSASVRAENRWGIEVGFQRILIEV